MNEYEELINIISKNNVPAPELNKSVDLLISIKVNVIRIEHYKLIEDFIVFVAVYTNTSEEKKKSLDIPLEYIRSNNSDLATRNRTQNFE